MTKGALRGNYSALLPAKRFYELLWSHFMKNYISVLPP